MKHIFLLFITTLFLYTTTLSQSPKELIIGIWAFDKLIPTDSTQISNKQIKENKAVIVTFKKDGSFLTQKKLLTTVKTLGSGTYSISKNEKYLIQDGEEFLIIEINKNTLQFSVADNIVMKFTRQQKP